MKILDVTSMRMIPKVVDTLRIPYSKIPKKNTTHVGILDFVQTV